MNFVYLITNTSKNEGMRYYVGSKSEAFLGEMRGVPTIFNNSGLPYFGSSSNHRMLEDLKNGDVFSAKILEEVPQRDKLLSVEDKWITELGAVDSEEYYNLSQATLGGYMYKQDAVYNIFGETISEYGKRKSSLNNKNNTAKKAGFKHMGEMCFHIHKLRCDGMAWAETSRHMGFLKPSQKGKTRMYVKDYDMYKAANEYDPNNTEMINEIRKYVAEGATVKKAAELLGIELPTAAMYIGGFDEIYERGNLVAAKLLKTKDELEIEITKKVISGKRLIEISRELSIPYTSVYRYFVNCVKKYVVLP